MRNDWILSRCEEFIQLESSLFQYTELVYGKSTEFASSSSSSSSTETTGTTGTGRTGRTGSPPDESTRPTSRGKGSSRTVNGGKNGKHGKYDDDDSNNNNDDDDDDDDAVFRVGDDGFPFPSSVLPILSSCQTTSASIATIRSYQSFFSTHHSNHSIVDNDDHDGNDDHIQRDQGHRALVSDDEGSTMDGASTSFGILRRQSTSSIASIDDRSAVLLATPTLSDSERKGLLTALRYTYEAFFKKRPFSFLPSCYYAIMEELWKTCELGSFLSVELLSLLITLLECIQVRFFQYILAIHYREFVDTDLFEYLIHEQTTGTASLDLQNVHRLSKYSSDRLRDCMIEIPYLKKMICEFSENAREVLSVCISPCSFQMISNDFK